MKQSNQQPKAESRVWVCEFGIRHEIYDHCGCEARYGVSRFAFSARCQKLHSVDGRPVFPSDVTEWIRRNVLDSFRNLEDLEKRNLA